MRTSAAAGLLVAATLIAVGATDVGAAMRSPVPAPTARRIKAEYGQFAYLPGLAPPGLIFTSWRIDPASAGYLMSTLRVTFGRNGTRLIWSVSDGRGQESYADCSSRPYYTSTHVIGGRRVYYARGNHGPNPAGSSITIYFSKTAPIGTRVAWFVVN